MNQTEDTSEDPFFSAPADVNLVRYCVAATTLSLLAVSLSFNLGTIFTVCCSKRPRRYGYFHLLVLFCLLHVSYFAVKAAYLALDALNMLDYVDDQFMEDNADLIRYAPDLSTCLFGTCLLLLTAMTVDCLSSHCVASRPIQKCVRIFLAASAVVVGVVVFHVVLVIKFKLIFEDLLQLSTAARLLIVTCVYLVAFALVPTFVIVILGTVNWVTDRNSSRPIKGPRRVARRLDARVCWLSAVLLLLFLVTRIVQFSSELRVYGEEEEARMTRAVVEVAGAAVDALFAAYPMVFACALGRFCCCNDDEDDEDVE